MRSRDCAFDVPLGPDDAIKWGRMMQSDGHGSFSQTIKPDFSNFDEMAAWPYLLDEFVGHMNEKRGKK